MLQCYKETGSGVVVNHFHLQEFFIMIYSNSDVRYVKSHLSELQLTKSHIQTLEIVERASKNWRDTPYTTSYFLFKNLKKYTKM